MKKFLLMCSFLYGFGISAQTYCAPNFTTGCTFGDNIDSFTIPGANFSDLDTGCSNNSYGDYVSQVIALNAGVNYPFTITHGYSNQYVKIWIDFNNDGTFNDSAPELVAEGNSTFMNNVDMTSATISIPASITPGSYRLRVADSYSSVPIPCTNSGYGEVHDYTANIGAAPSCISPSNLTVNAVGATSANLSWTASPSVPAAGYEYYISTSGTTPANTVTATGSVSGAVLTSVLPNLSSNTTYHVWLRSVCTSANRSSWSLPVTFTTPCATVTPNYTYDFGSGIDACWGNANGGNPSTAPTGNISNWNVDGFLNNGFDGAMRVNIYTNSFNSGFNSWLITPAFNLSGGNYRVKFDYGLTAFSDTVAASLGSDDKVQFVVSQDGGTTWTVLATWSAANSPSNTSNQYTFNLNSYTGASTRFAFYATNGSVADTNDVDFFIDNLVVEQNALSVNDSDHQNNLIKVFPNPFSEVLNISPVDKVKSVSITDMAGRVVKTIQKPSSSIHLGTLISGTYFVILEMSDGTRQTVKAIKK